ncbi:MAG: FimV type pilus assembly protein [Pseudomonadota bacterium]|jgi:pilus assembly protein FimV
MSDFLSATARVARLPRVPAPPARAPVVSAARSLSAAAEAFGWRWLVLMIGIFWASASGAVGLGGLTVLSSLGQPLHLEVSITGWAGEPISAVRVPAPAARGARRAELLQFEVDGAGTALPVLRVRSREPVDEPFMELVLQLDSPHGRVVRAYTFLLDPPGMRPVGETVPGTTVSRSLTPSGPGLVSAPAAAIPSPAPSTGPTPQRASERAVVPSVSGVVITAPVPSAATMPVPETPAVAPPAASPPAVAPPATAPAMPSTAIPPPVTPTSPTTQALNAAAAASTPNVSPLPVAVPAETGAVTVTTPAEIQVPRGTTLSEIAQKLRPPGASLEQTMVALYRANPSAFGGTVHVLRAGARLDVPSAADIIAVAPAEARQLLKLHAEQFRAQREQIAAAPRQVEGRAPAQTVGGAVGGASSTPVVEAAPGDRLELSKAGLAGSGGADRPTAQAVAPSESAVALENALREQNERIALLEQNLKSLQTLLALRNEQLAQLQGRAQVASETTAPTAPSVSGSVSSAAQSGAKGAASAAASPSATPVTAPATAVTAAASTAAPPSTAVTPVASNAAPSAGVMPPVSNAAPNSSVTPATPADAGKTDQPAPLVSSASSGLTAQPVAQQRGLEELLAHPWVLPATAAGLLLVTVLIGWSLFGSRQRRPLLGDEPDVPGGAAVRDARADAPVWGASAESSLHDVVNSSNSSPSPSSRQSGPDGSSPLEKAIGGRFELPSLELGAEASAATTAAPVQQTVRDSAPEPPRQAAQQTASETTREPRQEPATVTMATATNTAATGAAQEAVVEGVASATPAPTSQAVAGISPAIRRQMASQLELAAAYLEIGDHERARELLEGVRATGDSQQQQRAREMLNRL